MAGVWVFFFRMSPWQTIIGNCKNAASARIVSLAGVQSSETTFCLDQRDVKTVCPDPAKISCAACTCLESNITPESAQVTGFQTNVVHSIVQPQFGVNDTEQII